MTIFGGYCCVVNFIDFDCVSFTCFPEEQKSRRGHCHVVVVSVSWGDEVSETITEYEIKKLSL